MPKKPIMEMKILLLHKDYTWHETQDVTLTTGSTHWETLGWNDLEMIVLLNSQLAPLGSYMPVPLPCPHTVNTLSSDTHPIKHTPINSWDFSGSGLSLTLPAYITLGKSQPLWASFSPLVNTEQNLNLAGNFWVKSHCTVLLVSCLLLLVPSSQFKC